MNTSGRYRGLFAKIYLLESVCIAASLFGSSSPVRADALGNPIYGPFRPNEGGEYPRAIRLQHSGKTNGALLATFEHTFRDGTPGDLVIKRSTDDGATWSVAATISEPNKWPTMWQPFLLELPKRIGQYPEGTILLAENSSNKNNTRILLFSSLDHGITWRQDQIVTSGGGPKQGVWEPFLLINAKGQLTIYFSDERQSSHYSQFLGGYLYNERANAFDTLSEINLASGSQTDRPGMVTIAQIPGRGFMAAYEVCTSLKAAFCPVHTKMSPDGTQWPIGIGNIIAARDNNAPSNNPYLVWSPIGGTSGRLSMTAMHTATPASNLVLINDDPAFRSNAWEWTPRPYASHNTQYSVSLLPSQDGHQMRLFGAARLSEAVRPYVLTATANAGVLPYADTFKTGADYGWLDFGGIWTISNDPIQGVYTEGGGPGVKAIAGASLWRDYILRSDIRLNQPGQAGVLVRVSSPGLGADKVNGYYIGINPQSGILFGGREDGGWTQLASAPARGLAVGHWYTIVVQALGSKFDAVVTDRNSSTPIAHLSFIDDRFASGAIGLRDFNASTSWHNVRVDAIGNHSPRQGMPMMPSGQR